MRNIAKMRSSLDRDQLHIQPSFVQILLLAQHGLEVIRDVLGPPDHLDRTRLWVDPLELRLGQTAAVDEEFDSDEVSSAELVGREKTGRSVRMLLWGPSGCERREGRTTAGSFLQLAASRRRVGGMILQTRKTKPRQRRFLSNLKER